MPTATCPRVAGCLRSQEDLKLMGTMKIFKPSGFSSFVGCGDFFIFSWGECLQACTEGIEAENVVDSRFGPQVQQLGSGEL